VDRLLYVIAHTTDLPGMRRYYRDQVGLEIEQDNPNWVDFRTGGARLGIMSAQPGRPVEIELSFHAPDLDARVAALRGHGVEFLGDIRQIPFGRVAHLRDPEGNLVSLYAPHHVPRALEAEPRLVAIVNADDLAGTVSFYRDVLGLELAGEAEGWVEFETGDTRLAVHRRAHGEDHPDHAAQPVVHGFEVSNLDRAAASMRSSGLHFTTAPTDADFGPFAEAEDPEGNIVLFREPAVEPALEEVLAAAYEDDGPARIAIRKPVKKQSKAISRIVVRPEYRPHKPAARKAEAAAASAPAKPKPRAARAAGVRGAGPAGARRKPKTTRDVKRAKAKPAVGRSKKAVRKVLAQKKRATAAASRGKPVKRAAKGRARPRARAAARRGSGRR
jgi:predicted enzyme related to lactoylglutathione lyase